MQDYFDAYEAKFNRPAAMKSDVAEDYKLQCYWLHLVTRIAPHLAMPSHRFWGVQDHLDWKSGTATLLQEYDEMLLRDGVLGKTLKDGDEARALMAGGSGRGNHRWKKKLLMKNETRKG